MSANNEATHIEGHRFMVSSDPGEVDARVRLYWNAADPFCMVSVSMTPDQATDIAAALLAHSARFLPKPEVWSNEELERSNQK